MTALVASVTRPSRLERNAFKNLDSHDELEAIETLQTEIWHFEPQSVTPRHVFIAAVRSGGLVLGAFDQRGYFGWVFP